MARRITPKAKPVQMRNVLVELPENKMLTLSWMARQAGRPLHEFAAEILTDWLENAFS
jgi:hypothetical protein